MAPAQDRRLLQKANGRLADYLIDSDEAQELHDLREVLDRMVEDSACSICYEPLRKMFTASCGHSYCIRVCLSPFLPLCIGIVRQNIVKKVEFD